MLVAVSGVMAFARYAPPSNPFTLYADISLGQPQSAAIQHGFACLSINESSDTLSCVNPHIPPVYPFSQIHLSTTDDVIRRVSFTVLENALTIGDLAALWGKPAHRTLYNRMATACWPSRGITALTILPYSRRFSYFQPVVHVSFAAPFTPDGCS